MIESPLFVGYLLVFGSAAIACFVSARRAKRIADRDTRRGLVGLLVTSGVWATIQLVFLLVPSAQLKTVAYIGGLVAGFSTVGPWLYFCSAYTGRSLHRQPAIRRIAIGIFLTVVAVKVTNPLHQLYFTAELVTVPFPHLAIQNGLIQWVVVGVAYSLAIVGYFMLFELFWQVGHDTRPLVALVGVTAVPVIADLAAIASPTLPEFTFEPLGVAVFAIGVLFVYLEEFQALQLTERRDDPAIFLDDDGRVREFNAAAERLFPKLRSDARIGTAVPEINDRARKGEIIEVDRDGEQRYYRLSSTSFTTDLSRIGEVITLTDVTEREQYRAELERQNERLDQFAQTISHDLRNPLNVAQGHVDAARRNRDDDHLETADTALTRMEDIIQDVLTLARTGQPIEEKAPLTLSAAATAAWEVVETKDAELVIEDDTRLLADVNRVQQLLENLFRNAIEHGGSYVTIRIGPLEGDTGFYVSDDGVGISPDHREDVFESGYSTARNGTGLGLAIVNEVATAHGWDIRIVESTHEGARFEFTVTGAKYECNS